ncbi:Integrase catalytic domain-containing protein [Aphis craccivora]|uniref:Integrase catalytic domain-containing protein n=1 Tax=Aphis craccivora TaxID=307492 RepID=A0A6G0WJ61_APHCR|nr:Integrase catalytic domain-containing protein [Aphis craccivora]
MNNITTESTIKILREYFSLWGLPAKLVTDNGPSLVSEVMEEFLARNGVFHVKTPPYNPASNGAAENLVRTFKNFLKKSGMKSDLDTEIARFMLSYNSTKHCATGVTPAELHIGRKLFTSFDRLVPRAKYRYNNSMLAAKIVYKRGRVKMFEMDDDVICRNYASGAKWIRGTIIQVLSPVTYMVQCVGGEVWKRHINQLLGTSVAETNPCIKTLTNSVLGPKAQLPSVPVEEVVSEVSGAEDSLETEQQDVPKLWRSERIKKIPNRLNL